MSAVNSMVQGYHEYKESSSENNELICKCEVRNPYDTHAVAIKKSVAREYHTVGHIPKKFSSVCSIFIKHGCAIYCTVGGHRHYAMF